MSLYNDVLLTIDSMEVGDIVTIDVPVKLKAFRKFLSEISGKHHKKFTTKILDGNMHIMRVKYFSVTEKLNNNG